MCLILTFKKISVSCIFKIRHDTQLLINVLDNTLMQAEINACISMKTGPSKKVD